MEKVHLERRPRKFNARTHGGGKSEQKSWKNKVITAKME
jgi:hypothetical protein